ncbi:MAG: fatty acid desaturase [candidate division Zixibacteria bacterium]|nr:fatty acid desaturase [candidate division Zixibacteria bacterium]
MPSIDSRQLLEELAPYQRPGRWRSIWQLLNSLIPYVALWYIAYLALAYSFWLALPIIVLIAGFLVRIFIIFHDCGHGSFFRSKKANNFWGRVTGIVTFTPYHYWKSSHARHHATSANLDRRGEGDVWMMTLREYLQAPRMERLKYRLYRNPLVLFLLGPLALTLIKNRIAGKKANRAEKYSVYGTNCAVALVVAAMMFLVGWKAFLIIQFLAVFLAYIAGVWLFYVQHQYEGVYWERDPHWDFVTASLEGGSFYKLPAIMRWFSGNIGYHHLHHLNSRIPNYNLPHCQGKIPALQQTRSIGLLASLKSLNYRLWDEETGRLISFRELRRLYSERPSTDINSAMTSG